MAFHLHRLLYWRSLSDFALEFRFSQYDFLGGGKAIFETRRGVNSACLFSICPSISFHDDFAIARLNFDFHFPFMLMDQQRVVTHALAPKPANRQSPEEADAIIDPLGTIRD